MKELEVNIVPASIEADGVHIVLPLEIVKALRLKKKDKQLFAVLTNNIIQLSSREPHASLNIPALDCSEFTPQK